MAIKYDAICKVGEYKDAETGEAKAQWRKLGIVVDKGDGKLSLKLDVIPVNFSGWIQLVEPKGAE